MKVYYDNKVDALYLKLGDEEPDGVIEISEGINIDSTSSGRVVGIELLNVSQKIDINTIFNYSLELDKNIITQKSA